MSKHNKKRNTAFIFEILVRQMTKYAFQGNHSGIKNIKRIFTEHFKKSSLIYKEKKLYDSLLESSGLDLYSAEKLIHLAKEEHSGIDQGSLFKEQSAVISAINKALPTNIWNSFVPNYRYLATINQIFNKQTPVNKRVILEKNVRDTISLYEQNKKTIDHIDNIVYKKFVENFNTKNGNLLPEQKSLLSRYILAGFRDEIDFKVYLNEELSKIKGVLTDSLEIEEVKSDKEMMENMLSILERIDEFKTSTFVSDDLGFIMSAQKLAHEVLN